ncbi:restriction endonuclease subunit S [Elizabethkingia anophelis]|nr:restriction endonuclease subunit S [Elizabethkingia anophelis]
MRFPEFTEEWETKKLGEILEFKNGINATKEQYGSGYKFINVLDILNNEFITHDKIIGSVNVNEEIIDKFPVNYGDILFQRSSETREEVGTTSVYLDKDKTATFGGFVIRGKKNGEYEPIFLNKSLKTDLVRNQITSKSGGSTRYNIGQEILASVTLYFPSLNEQTKIASFLSLIDSRIQTQNKIIEELKLLKNTLSKKIISGQLKFKDKNGNNFPEWVSKELAEVMSVPEKIKSKNIDKSRLLTVKLHLKGVSQNDNTNTLSLGATNYFIRKKGQFIYGKQNLFNGAFGIIPDEFDGFLSSGDVPALDIKHSKINTAYLIYFLGRVDFYKRLEDLAAGSGSKRIHETTLLGIKIDFPTIEEQHKIASFLLSIDGKIEIETNILQKLERQNTYFLANLFI